MEQTNMCPSPMWSQAHLGPGPVWVPDGPIMLTWAHSGLDPGSTGHRQRLRSAFTTVTVTRPQIHSQQRTTLPGLFHHHTLQNECHISGRIEYVHV